MKFLLPEISAKELARLTTRERMQYDEVRGEAMATQINRLALGGG